MHAIRPMRMLRRAPVEVKAWVARHRTGVRRQRLDPARGLFLIQRLENLGIDPDYVRVAKPELFATLATACRNCAGTATCARDLAMPDFNDRAVAYCPNTARIDALLVRKL